MSNEKNEAMDSADVTPESLMERFRGPGLLQMVIVTVVFHAVLVFGTSIGYLKKSLFGDELAAMSKEKRIEKAVGEATSSLRKIAAENGLNPQDISDNFSSSAARAAKVAAAADKGTAVSTNVPTGKAPVPNPDKDAKTEKPDRPESKIEKDIKKAVKGPDVPPAVGKDDIF